MREVVLGTAGHVDHGKTSLVKALTGINTDRLAEEQKRGITIELGFAHLDLPCGHRLGIVDVPGHEKFVKNMVAGASGIDLVALVVAADEGVMPQTREHFDICRLLGVTKGCVIITKIDMVEPEWLELVCEETREFLAGSFLADAPMVCASSVTGQGLEQVRQTLDDLVRECTFIEATGPFRLAVDRVFSMKGFGAVVTGTAMSGRIRVGDPVAFYPGERKAKVRGIQVHNAGVEEGEAGHRTAINIQGLDQFEISRGEVLATPGCLRPSYVLDADFFYLAGNEKQLKNRTRVRIHIGTAEIMGRIAIQEGDTVSPGSTVAVQLLLEEPVGIWPGDHYVVRSYSPVYTIGGGVLYANCDRKRARLKGKSDAVFKIYRQGSEIDKALLHLAESGTQGLTAAELAVKMGVFGKRLTKLLNGPISSRQVAVVESDRQRMVHGQVVADCQAHLERFLRHFHQAAPLKPGIGKEELKSSIGRYDQKLFLYLLQTMERQGKIVAAEGVVRLADHQVALQENDQELAVAMAALYQQAGLQPPRVKEVMAHFSQLPGRKILDLLALLTNEERIVRVSEELYFSTTVIADLETRLRSYLEEHGEIDAQGFKNLTGITRKFSIPLLEFFDRRKVTIRVENKRVLRR